MGGDFNSLFGHDPCQGVTKELKVSYECLEPPQEELCPIPNESQPNASMNGLNIHSCGVGEEPGASNVR